MGKPRVLRTFEEPVSGPDGRSYVARICGRRRADERWESWVEFIPAGGTPVLRSRRETTQIDLRNLERWAARLTRVYLQGSLHRTLQMQAPRRHLLPPHPEAPHFDAPSPERAISRPLAPDDAVLNPIVHFRRGEPHLRKKLAELSASELRNLARAYGIHDGRSVDVDTLEREALVELIVAWVKGRA